MTFNFLWVTFHRGTPPFSFIDIVLLKTLYHSEGVELVALEPLISHQLGQVFVKLDDSSGVTTNFSF